MCSRNYATPVVSRFSTGPCWGCFGVGGPNLPKEEHPSASAPSFRQRPEPRVATPRIKSGAGSASISQRVGETVLPGKDVGVSSNLTQRVWQHKSDMVDGFTKRYGVHMLVWHEPHDTMESAIAREKVIKACKRAWKMALIEGPNPQ